MRLAINVGNTNVQYGIFKSGKLTWVTCPVGAEIPDLPTPTAAVWMASVNPVEADRIAAAQPSWQFRLLNAEAAQGWLTWNYTRPEQLGADRIANLLGLSSYPLPALAIDAGTATTFELLIQDGVGFAGPILPGPGLMLKSLNQTAMLPLVSQDARAKLDQIKDTESAIGAGVALAHVGAVRETIRALMAEYCVATAVLTGGARGPLAQMLDAEGLQTVEDPGLTLRGLRRMDGG